MLWLLSLALGASSPSLPVAAIDPGHGGRQWGAVGRCGVVEKDLTLAIATRLASILGASERARPLLVRTSDEDVALEERSRRANEGAAQVLVSIHANASSNPTARGVETFFLSRRAASRRIRALAARENEGAQLRFHRPSGTLENILHRLLLDATHHESQRLAFRLQRELSGQVATRGRGVLQAPLLVLYGARMASALVEVGFVTNDADCRRLREPEQQQLVAEALATAILAHLADEGVRLAASPAPGGAGTGLSTGVATGAETRAAP